VKILLVHNFYNVTGGECHAVRAQQRLLEQNGHEVVAFFRENKALKAASPLTKLVAATGARENHAAMRELKRLVRRERPMLAHVHNVFPMISPSIYRHLHVLGVPVVQSVHNLRLRCPGGLMYRQGQVCEECTTRGLQRAVVNRCVQGSLATSLLYADAVSHAWRKGYFTQGIDRFIVFNDFFGAQMRAAGIPAERVSLLPNFVPTPETAVARKSPYALYLGRLSPEKGIATLLDAWLEVEGLTLKIAGGGDLSKEVERRCETELAGKAEYLGYVQGEEKQQLLRHASLSILPSECHENCPISLLESLAAGTAVVVTRMGGLPGMVKEDETGFVVEPGDAPALAEAVKRFREKPMLADVMGRSALAEARDRYGPEAHYQGLMAIYREICEQSAAASQLAEASGYAG
jgi:glycosyltransferase involved in cell wall biosynthesis